MMVPTLAELVAAKSARLWLNSAGSLSPQPALNEPLGDEPAELPLTLGVGAEPVSKLASVWLVAATHGLAYGLAGPDARVLCLPLKAVDSRSAIVCLGLADNVPPSELEQGRLVALAEQTMAGQHRSAPGHIAVVAASLMDDERRDVHQRACP